ncbi:MAG TPA: HAMP domain-containing sensor histidine kinase [Hyphomicrobiaceae bacterium]|nr:HAMP domain-containing sensor histidine kinase [Hyphomicrobiaceae bacterium]
MQQASERATFGLLSEDPAYCGIAALLIDLAKSAVLNANAAGWALLGVGAGEPHLALPLDCAMPAVQQLRGLPADGGKHCATLTFWSRRGSIRATCEVSISDGQAALRLVRVLRLEKDLPPSHAEITTEAAPPRRALGCDDVELRSKLAHELRTPLGAVIAYAEILKDEHFGPIASDRYKGYARNIYESARHAMGVLDGMLKADCEPPGLPQLTFADIEPARIVESCLLVAHPLAEKAGLTLSAEVPTNLPRIVADAVSLRQMLLNLLANAIKFARSGDRVKVTVAHDVNGPLRISVVDTGPGMDTTDHAVDQTIRLPQRLRPANAGLGLGLPLTRTLAEANGAVLAIDSTLGRGTCATISFGKDRLVLV